MLWQVWRQAVLICWDDAVDVAFFANAHTRQGSLDTVTRHPGSPTHTDRFQLYCRALLYHAARCMPSGSLRWWREHGSTCMLPSVHKFKPACCRVHHTGWTESMLHEGRCSSRGRRCLVIWFTQHLVHWVHKCKSNSNWVRKPSLRARTYVIPPAASTPGSVVGQNGHSLHLICA